MKPGQIILASRRSLLVVFLLAAGGGCRPPGDNPPAAGAHLPRLFEDITPSSGLNFVHDSGAHGGYFMPEHLGSGAAVLDFDNDGRLDLYLVQHGGP
ncbi:MAG TPA: hypothetical protein VNO52_02470, partial [Methylomirabilota bacterium]|nr:hypothetical protein [Methylomirabilota bacterium]